MKKEEKTPAIERLERSIDRFVSERKKESGREQCVLVLANDIPTKKDVDDSNILFYSCMTDSVKDLSTAMIIQSREDDTFKKAVLLAAEYLNHK